MTSGAVKRIATSMGVRPDSHMAVTFRKIYRESRAFFSPRSYSQFGEDAILRTYFSGPGFYLDVGAGRPFRGSNTYSLYKSGWRGVLIEPLRSNVRDLRLMRPRDQVVQALCGSKPGRQHFYEFSEYEYSTTLRSRVSDLAIEGKLPSAEFSVPVVSIESLKLRAEPNRNTLMSVDVEGSEMEVLLGIDWTQFRPKVICIEEWRSPIHNESPIRALLREQGYTLDGYTRCSSIYVHG